jgi:hypothetical protein
MKWAIVFYALFNVNGEQVEHISWGLTFPHHENCLTFYDKNENRILGGLNDFAKNNLDTGAILKEVGCSHATADFDGTTKTAITSLKMPVWQGERI